MNTDVEWPRHPKSYWRDVLDYARSNGWTFRKHSDHSFGKIACPDGRCEIVVFSTGVAGESVAIGARRTIDRCPHGRAAGWVQVAEGSLNRADLLLDAAEHLCDRAGAETDFDELEDGAADLDDRISELISQIEVHEAKAQWALGRAGVTPDPPVGAIVDMAQENIAQSRQALTKVAAGGIRRRLSRRLHVTRERLLFLKRRVEGADTHNDWAELAIVNR